MRNKLCVCVPMCEAGYTHPISCFVYAPEHGTNLLSRICFACSTNPQNKEIRKLCSPDKESCARHPSTPYLFVIVVGPLTALPKL